MVPSGKDRSVIVGNSHHIPNSINAWIVNRRSIHHQLNGRLIDLGIPVGHLEADLFSQGIGHGPKAGNIGSRLG